jgi:hypothetical protein
MAYVKAGMLDGVAIFGGKPVAEIFTRSRVPWLQAIDGAHQKEEMA